MLFHAELSPGRFHPFLGGYIGVDVFFVISGYLIGRIILGELQAGRFSFTRFYERRARRILPALYLVMLACIPPALWLMTPWQLQELAETMAATVGFFSNFLFWKEAGYFDVAALEKPLLHTWSLAVEEQFYFLFPPILLALHRFARRFIIPVCIVLGLVSLGFAEWVSGRWADAAFYLLPFRGWELLGGAVLARLELGRGRPRNATLSGIFGILGLLAILVPAFLFDEDTRHPSLMTLIPVAGTMALIWFCDGESGASRLLASTPLVGVGLVSYSFYLWHFPVFAFAGFATEDLSNGAKAACIALSFALAALSYRAVERPFRHAARMTRPRLIVILLVGTLSLLGFAGVAIWTKGLPSRFDKADLTLINFNPETNAAYVRARFQDHRLRPFAEDGRLKVLIVGDSYGQDLANALHGGGLLEGAQLSTDYIPAICGNLLVEQDLTDLMADRDRAVCSTHPRYERPELRALLQQADVVWLASNWLDWHIPLLRESVSRIGELTNARILVLGTKHFRKRDVQELIRLRRDDRRALQDPAPDRAMDLNRQLEAVVPSYMFIDIQSPLCPRGKCPVFDEELNWISYDGGHLTEPGAAHMGRLLADDPRVRSAHRRD